MNCWYSHKFVLAIQICWQILMKTYDISNQISHYLVEPAKGAKRFTVLVPAAPTLSRQHHQQQHQQHQQQQQQQQHPLPLFQSRHSNVSRVLEMAAKMSCCRLVSFET